MNQTDTLPLEYYCQKNRASFLERFDWIQLLAERVAALHAQQELADLVSLNAPQVTPAGELLPLQTLSWQHPAESRELIIPELLLRGSHGESTDVFIWGCAAYRILTGEEPYDFHALPASESVKRIQNTRPRPLSAGTGEEFVPHSLENLIFAALAFEENRRPSAKSLCICLDTIRKKDLVPLQCIRRVKKSAANWHLTGESPALLWRAPVQLAEADKVYALHRKRLSESEKRFIRESIRLRKKEALLIPETLILVLLVENLSGKTILPPPVLTYLVLVVIWRWYVRFHGKPFADSTRQENILRFALIFSGIFLPFFITAPRMLPLACSIALISLIWLWDLLVKLHAVRKKYDCASVMIWDKLQYLWPLEAFLCIASIIAGTLN